MRTILLIEDNAEILDNLTEGLEMEGYTILTASNSKESLDFARTLFPDLIICDVLMPEMNGLDVLRLLLETPGAKKIPFIFSSSMSATINRQDALKPGADDCLVKPFEMELLFEMAAKWIESGSSGLLGLIASTRAGDINHTSD